MSETQEKLAVVPTIKDGVTIGIKNIVPIVVNVLLWALTVWIPYLNIGTTIGLFVGIIAMASRGESIRMTEIFDPKYRKYMGEYLITTGLIWFGVSAGLLLFIIPGIIISFAWSLAIILVIDKGKHPTEAMTLSNNLTYGHKLRIACVYILTFLAFLIVQAILAFIGSKTWKFGFIGFLGFLTMLFESFVFIGLQASIYRQLTGTIIKSDEIKTFNSPAQASAAEGIEKYVFCGECGTKNEIGTKFCSNCGVKL